MGYPVFCFQLLTVVDGTILRGCLPLKGDLTSGAAPRARLEGGRRRIRGSLRVYFRTHRVIGQKDWTVSGDLPHFPNPARRSPRAG
jgi:hypothetical protein